MAKRRISNTRTDTIFLVNQIFDKIINDKQISKDELIRNYDLNTYGYEQTIKLVREMLTIKYPYGCLVFNVNKQVYYAVF